MPPGRPRKNPILNGPFNGLIDQRMKMLGIPTYNDFAEFAGIGRTTLFGLLRGRISMNGTWTKPGVDTLVKLADALNVSTHDLLYMLEPEAPGAEITSTTINQEFPKAAMPPNGLLNDFILGSMKVAGISSIGEFADRAGIGRATMYNLVQGRVSANGTPVKPSLDTLVKLADVLHKPTHELLYILEPDARGSESIQVNTNMIAVPVLGYAGAGPGQNHILEENQIFVSRAFANGKRLGAFHIKGDSMAGGKRPIHNDDIVIADFLNKGNSGDAVIACLDEHQYICKALKIDKFGSFLTSLNPLYTNSSPAIIPADQVQEIVGKVVRVIGNVESLEG